MNSGAAQAVSVTVNESVNTVAELVRTEAGMFLISQLQRHG